MLARAVTEMVTVPSKVADTREPLRVMMMPVVLNISRPGRLGDRGGRNQHGNPVGPRLGSSEGSRCRGETLRAALGWPGGTFSSVPKPNSQDTPSFLGTGDWGEAITALEEGEK